LQRSYSCSKVAVEALQEVQASTLFIAKELKKKVEASEAKKANF